METIVVTSEQHLKNIIREIIKEELALYNSSVDTKETQLNEELMTREEVAKYFKISLVTLTSWVKQGLPCIRKGRNVRFQMSEVLAAVKNQHTKKKGPNHK